MPANYHIDTGHDVRIRSDVCVCVCVCVCASANALTVSWSVLDMSVPCPCHVAVPALGKAHGNRLATLYNTWQWHDMCMAPRCHAISMQ